MNKHVENFIAILNRVADKQGNSLHWIFENFLRSTSAFFNDDFNSPEIKTFNWELFGELLATYRDTPPYYFDLLGEVVKEIRIPQTKRISKLAETVWTPDYIQKEVDNFGVININDFDCGSGTAIIDKLNFLRSECYVLPSTQVIVNAFATDIICVLMTHIQLSLYGVPAFIAQNFSSGSQYFHTPIFTTPAIRNLPVEVLAWKTT